MFELTEIWSPKSLACFNLIATFFFLLLGAAVTAPARPAFPADSGASTARLSLSGVGRDMSDTTASRGLLRSW